MQPGSAAGINRTAALYVQLIPASLRLVSIEVKKKLIPVRVTGEREGAQILDNPIYACGGEFGVRRSGAKGDAPANFAERIPAGASSITTHSAGANPTLFAPSK
jgi:hypothetical protein